MQTPWMRATEGVNVLMLGVTAQLDLVIRVLVHVASLLCAIGMVGESRASLTVTQKCAF